MAKLFEKAIGKDFLIFYNDTDESVTAVHCKFLDYDPVNIKVIDNKEKEILIPISRIVRMVVK